MYMLSAAQYDPALSRLQTDYTFVRNGKSAAAEMRSDALLPEENSEIALPSPLENGNGSGSGSGNCQGSELIHRIRALRQRSVRTTPGQ